MRLIFSLALALAACGGEGEHESATWLCECERGTVELCLSADIDQFHAEQRADAACSPDDVPYVRQECHCAVTDYDACDWQAPDRDAPCS